MKALLMTLKGALRAYGGLSIGDDRWTEPYPSASAVLGLAGACMGVDRHDPQAVAAWYAGFEVCSLSAALYLDQAQDGMNYSDQSSIGAEFQTVPGSTGQNGIAGRTLFTRAAGSQPRLTETNSTAAPSQAPFPSDPSSDWSEHPGAIWVGGEAVPLVLEDFHVARGVLGMDGRPRAAPVIGYRGYMMDGCDTVALLPRHPQAEAWLAPLAEALHAPCYTPYLGRRSNPLAAPPLAPGEGVQEIASLGALAEALRRRLGRALPAGRRLGDCTLRLPAALEPSALWEDLAPAWQLVATRSVPDERGGAPRAFRYREVRVYRPAL